MANAQSKALFPTVLAAAGIVAGMFGPLARAGGDAGIFGNVTVAEPTYLDFFQTQGYVLMGIAAVAVVFALRGMGRLIWACAAGVWLTLLWPMVKNALTPEDDSIGGQIKDIISDEVSKVASEHAGIIFDVTSLSWGGFALLGGAVLMIVAGLRGR